MLVATRYTVSFDASAGVYVVKNNDAPVCPECGSPLSGYDRRRRKAICQDGSVRIYLLRRLRCPRCGTLHTEIPDILIPHKHYEADVINAVRSGNDALCPADDSTICRWKK